MKNKKLNIIIALLVLVALTVGVYMLLIKNRDYAKDNNGTESPAYLSPPTQLEQSAGDEVKQNQPDANDSDENIPKNKESTEVVISDASQYGDVIEVRAFMPSVLQNGNCTLTFSLDGDSFTINESAYADASSTICTSRDIDLSNFSKSGIWNLNVSFDSENYYGTADMSVEISK